MRAAAAALLAAAALCFCAHPPRAEAHGEYTPTIQTKIDRVSPAVKGLQVRVFSRGPALLDVRNDTGRDLVVVGERGEDFLRIGQRGVEANVNSITWYRSGNPDGQASPPAGVRIGGPVRWVRVSRKPRWSWFDHRMHPGTRTVSPRAIQNQRRARLDDWVVPARLGGRPLRVEGHVEYQPLTGSVVSRLRSSAAVTPKLQLALLAGQIPGFFLVNLGREPATVVGREGEPFARLGPRGVQVNLRSATWLEDQRARGRGSAVAADPEAPPRWRRVATVPRFTWVDARALYPNPRPPEDVVRKPSPTVLKRWSVPIDTGGRRLEVRGETRWVPFDQAAMTPGGSPSGGGTPVWLLVLLGALAVTGLGGAVALRRRAS